VEYGSLESTAKIAFVVFEFPAFRFVFFFFYVAQPDPPHFTRPVDAFGAGVFQRAANCVSLAIIGHDYYDGSPFAQGILINVQFVFRQSFEYVALQLSPCGAAANGTKRAEYDASGNSDREHRPHSWNQKARDHRHQSNTACNAHGSAHSRTDSFTHAGLLPGDRRHSRDRLIARVRCQYRDSMSRNIKGHKLRCANLRVRSRLENSYDGFHNTSFLPMII
jgi:hypothetical protein